MAQRARRRRKQRKSERSRAVSVPPPDSMARGYSRSRQRDEEVRASLEPLEPGERPLAVTIGAIAALALAVANVIALIVRYDADEGGKTTGTLLVTAVVLLIAWGMWKAKYWAVLGMQTLLAITIVGATLGALTALNLNAILLVVAILLPAMVLFWFLIKAMARIQMPTRPGQEPR